MKKPRRKHPVVDSDNLDSDDRPLDFDSDDVDFYWEKLDRETNYTVAKWVVGIFVVLLALYYSSDLAKAQETPPPPSATPHMGMSADQVDAIVRVQKREYLESILNWMKPHPPQFSVGLITSHTMTPGCPSIIHLTGWVVETAAKVEVRFDNGTAVPATLFPTLPKYPKTFSVCVPVENATAGTHKVYARAIRATGTVIGPLDNAKYASQWTYTLSDATPPPPPPPVAAAPIVWNPPALTVTSPSADFQKVEFLIDGSISASKYYGVKTFVDGKVTFTIKPAMLDGAEHYLDLRLYKPNAEGGVFRLAGHPLKLVFAPPAVEFKEGKILGRYLTGDNKVVLVVNGSFGVANMPRTVAADGTWDWPVGTWPATQGTWACGATNNLTVIENTPDGKEVQRFAHTVTVKCPT